MNLQKSTDLEEYLKSGDLKAAGAAARQELLRVEKVMSDFESQQDKTACINTKYTNVCGNEKETLVMLSSGKVISYESILSLEDNKKVKVSLQHPRTKLLGQSEFKVKIIDENAVREIAANYKGKIPADLKFDFNCANSLTVSDASEQMSNKTLESPEQAGISTLSSNERILSRFSIFKATQRQVQESKYKTR